MFFYMENFTILLFSIGVALLSSAAADIARKIVDKIVLGPNSRPIDKEAIIMVKSTRRSKRH
jgi:hypothetical protein